MATNEKQSDFSDQVTTSLCQLIPRDSHPVSREHISGSALKVLYRLNKAGYQAYLVGGGVRDMLVGLAPKDFDIATDAKPEEVRRLFSNCRLIGRRFRLAHIHFGDEIIEVATFRGSGETEGEDRVVQDGRVLRDNVYGSLEEDALRRDFTMNALYYSVSDFAIRDFSGGVEDIQQRRIRLIGSPATRYREDPVRMLRAARFAAKLNFEISEEAQEPILEMAPLLSEIPPARLFDETLKLFLGGYGMAAYEKLSIYGLLPHLLPETMESMPQYGGQALIAQALRNTDTRIREERPVTPAFLFAALLWPAFLKRKKTLLERGMDINEAMFLAADQTIFAQVQCTAIPRRFSGMTKEIWCLQHRFEARRGKRPFRFLAHKRFRAAYDFLELRSIESKALEESVAWWSKFQTDHPEIKPQASRPPPPI